MKENTKKVMNQKITKFKKKKLTQRTTWLYSCGQLGWSLLAAIVVSQLTSIWTGFSDHGTEWKGFIPVGVFSVVFMLSKVFDAISDPIVGFFSDKMRTKWGRRIPLMMLSSIPFAITSILVFIGFSQNMSTSAIALNTIMLGIMLILFYVALTLYTIPYTTLITELSSKSEDRVKLSMAIAITFFLGSLLAYGAPTIWTMLYSVGLDLRLAICLTMILFAIVAVIFLLIPVFTIKEKDYVDLKNLPAKSDEKMSLTRSIKIVFSFRKFRWFILADFLYWIGLIIFQSQVNAFVSSILGIELKNAIYFVGVMGIVSFILYGPISIIVNKMGVRKGIVQFSFFSFFIIFAFGAIMMLNRDNLNNPMAWVEGMIFVAFAGVPMAILGIVENVIVSDIVQFSRDVKQQKVVAPFYAIRNLTMKMGQAIGLGLGTVLLIFGKTTDNPLGIRLMLSFAAVTSLAGMLVMFFYEEVRYRGTKEIHKTVHLLKKINVLKDNGFKTKQKIEAFEQEIVKYHVLIEETEAKNKKNAKDKIHEYQVEIKFLEDALVDLNKKLIKERKETITPEQSSEIKLLENEVEKLYIANSNKINIYTKKKLDILIQKLSKNISKNKKRIILDEIAIYVAIRSKYDANEEYVLPPSIKKDAVKYL